MSTNKGTPVALGDARKLAVEARMEEYEKKVQEINDEYRQKVSAWDAERRLAIARELAKLRRETDNE